jgi:hypothetical protein
MQGETDCSDMAVYLWNMLQKKGVKTLLVIGTPDGEHTPFADCDHVWLACNTPDGLIGIEPTVPMVIYSNYVYTFRTSEEVDECIENDLFLQNIIENQERNEESRRELFEKCNIDYNSDRYELFQEELATIRSNRRIISRERPGDYSDFDYRLVGYCCGHG